MMDPNEALKWLRVELKQPEDDIDVAGVVVMFQALDEWLSKGGFVPKPWVNTQHGRDARAKLRMTDAQRQKLWDSCGNYAVPFRENDYYIESDTGFALGWVGGQPGTIYLCVEPNGDSHS